MAESKPFFNTSLHRSPEYLMNERKVREERGAQKGNFVRIFHPLLPTMGTFFVFGKSDGAIACPLSNETKDLS